MCGGLGYIKDRAGLPGEFRRAERQGKFFYVSWSIPSSTFFSPPFSFNKMVRFVLRFVFSTGTCFQQLLRFVLRFVFGYPCSLALCFQQLLRFVFEKRYSFWFFLSENPLRNPPPATVVIR